jgi:hypothetical protein
VALTAPEAAVRKWLLVALVLIAGVVALSLYGFYDGVTKDRAMRTKFGEIRDGMTLEEVESLVGRPPDEHMDLGIDMPGGTRRELKEWDGPGSLTIYVFLDEQGAVLAKHICPTKPTAWDRMRRRVLDRLGW